MSGAARVLALTRFRLRGSLSARVLLAPLVALVGLQVIGLAGGRQPAPVLLVTSACFALPPAAWLARQVLDSEPDEQAVLSALAVGGSVRAVLAGQLAAVAVVAPAVLVLALSSLRKLDGAAPPTVVLLGAALALVTALAAVAVGAGAARSVAGRGAAPVVVLVAAPVLVALVGLAGSPWVTALVPRLDDAVRATYPPDRSPPIDPNAWFVQRVPAVVAQLLVWGLVVLGLRLLLARRRS